MSLEDQWIQVTFGESVPYQAHLLSDEASLYALMPNRNGNRWSASVREQLRPKASRRIETTAVKTQPTLRR